MRLEMFNHKENIIELENVSFSYGDEKVLENIDLEIHRGDFFGIIGPNGGGKTTVIKIILGLLKPAGGQVKLFDSDIKKFKAWSKFGYVSQRATQFDANFPMTVEAVVALGRYKKRPSLFGYLDGYDKQMIAEALGHVGMWDHRKRLIGDLSGGEGQRVFIAKALAGEPEVIVLDEPTSGVDVKTQEAFYGLLRKLNSELNITLVLATHDLDLVEKEASDLFCVNKSALYCGLPKDFRTHKNYNMLSKEISSKPHHQ